MIENVVLNMDIATEFYIGMYRANGRTLNETCWLTSRGDGWTVSINAHYLLENPDERYTRIYGSPCFVYKYGTKFDTKEEAVGCFNRWIEVGRTLEEENEEMRPEWEEFARCNRERSRERS